MTTIESPAADGARLDDETRQLLSRTTQRLVNHAVEKRVDTVVRSTAEDDRVARRVWPVALAIALLMLAFSVGWLLRGAVH
jgi:diacylglycerol kinase